jgi:hypothetical protein
VSSETLFRALARLLGLYLMIDAVLRVVQLPMSYIALVNSELAVREKTFPYLFVSGVGVMVMFAIGFGVFRHFKTMSNNQSATLGVEWNEASLYALRLLAIYFIATGIVEGLKSVAGTILISGARDLFVNDLIQAATNFAGGWGLLFIAKPVARWVTKI